MSVSQRSNKRLGKPLPPSTLEEKCAPKAVVEEATLPFGQVVRDCDKSSAVSIEMSVQET